MNTSRVLVRGIGDIGSAVAHALFRAGIKVVVHDLARPAHARRGMAFTDAMFSGKMKLDGVYAKRARQPDDLRCMVDCGRAVPVVTDDIEYVVSALNPDVVVDARMRKRAVPEPQRYLAPHTIGLGPNFVAGEQTDIAIETAWGEELGRVIRRGATRPLEGEPREIAGHMRDRYVYAPVAGVFSTALEIGMSVAAGEIVATIGDIELRAPLGGRLRGLTHSDVEVALGTKVIEIDPRDADADIYGISERPRRIAQAVLAAIKRVDSRM
jgi:xanthine dehydrogenase accessory factor